MIENTYPELEWLFRSADVTGYGTRILSGRGDEDVWAANPQASMLALVDLDERVRPQHPLRTIKRSADRALADLSPTFDAIYGTGGRPSIPRGQLLKASLLISLYWVCSERAFCEELDYQLLWRWFLDLSLMEPKLRSVHVHQEPRTPVEREGENTGRASKARQIV